MIWDFEQIKKTVEEEGHRIKTGQDIENFRIKYLGKKGVLSEIYASLASATPDQKAGIGKGANEIKVLVQSIIDSKKDTAAFSEEIAVTMDLTLPGVVNKLGNRHLLTQTIDDICVIFKNLGFVVHEGSEIETEFHNFTALNIPADHPSRDSLDTFYLEAADPDNPDRKLLMRSQTSPSQIHIMKEFTPPLAVIVPGRVYRPDAVDASHSFMFHQIEGLLVDRDVRFSQLKGLLTVFCKKFFGDNIKMRFRPHYFPFTEPSAEVDISCYKCGGQGCSVCGRKGWLEILGCGMVHPKVFEACDYPKGKYSGLAFGMGVERIAMLKHGIPDIRIFYENDARFLNQFTDKV